MTDGTGKPIRSASNGAGPMFGAREIERAEREFGFRYPSAILAAVAALEALVATPAFASVFPQTQLVLLEDLAKAWAGR